MRGSIHAITTPRDDKTDYCKKAMMSNACGYWRDGRDRRCRNRCATNVIWRRVLFCHAALNDKSPAISICWRQIAQITPPPLSTDLQASCGAHSMRGRETPTKPLWTEAAWIPSTTMLKNSSRVHRSTVYIVSIHAGLLTQLLLLLLNSVR